MIKKALINIILLVLLTCFARGQETVTGLTSNILLNNGAYSKKTTQSLNQDTLELPFFDDFSLAGIIPDPVKWSDSYVFINNTYSNRQITTGIATMDALSETGSLYETATSVAFEADHLTSQPINLNNPASDNIWLSFHYQPGGIADPPEENDSLALQFYAPAEGKWHPVWRATGSNYPDFRAVTIKIDNSKFLKKGFRFRFVNYASLSANLIDPSIAGNCDHWNIDYVLLDKNRFGGDTVYADVAFRYPVRSLLNNHEAMPWKQFIEVYTSEMGETIGIHYRNNDIIPRNVTRNFEIWDVYNNKLSKSFTAGATNIAPLTSVDYDASHFYTFKDNTDSALFRIKSWLITDDFDPKQNDTIVYCQHFGNYFAFDDGSAEGGYGVNGLGSRNAMVAFRFRSFIEDTLRAISICFNDSYMNSNIRSFDLMIWDNANGLPGNVLYALEEVLVKPGVGVNGFHTYTLPSQVAVNGIFYIGWRQRSETFLNAGIDLNTPHGGKQYYWINGNWDLSQVSGTLMIRPVLGPLLNTAINDMPLRGSSLRFWPNPAGDHIFIDRGELQDAESLSITIFDLYGRKMISVPFREQIDISSLREGLYIIMAEKNGLPSGFSRLVKTR
ncbi:MAG: T9SS type A sorting domain-containing protein [Bacteroidota bacterium]